MSHFLLQYELSPQYLADRPRFRDEHLALAWRAADEGALILGGAVGDPIESALLLFRDAESATAFANADPYVREGLVFSWRVAPWATVVGAEAATPVRPSE
ncbi:YciI-like protein [Sphingomonas radiodurans]|uniref:YciI-like protein n=1 Tax=Sphingomonas radiodurans TaxID=2890321 RepID=UPI001E6291A5|nr:YciI-like protein [Sphingomonas radiodurans]WBH15550.1 YciI-like protein [Sphingomonas radiodurans]